MKTLYDIFFSLLSQTNDTTESPTDPPPPDPPTYFGPYNVYYDIEYPDQDCFALINVTMTANNETTWMLQYAVPMPYTATIELQTDITHGVTYVVQDVLETAVDEDDSVFFGVTYTGSTTGYFVRAIRGLRSNNNCMWFLYYKAPDIPYAFLKSTGVSLFTAEPNSTVVMRYQYPPVHHVLYELYFPHVNCTPPDLPRPAPLNISLYFGAPNYTYTVQKVMELAVDMDRSYEFSVTYYGKSRGYEIDAINGTDNHEKCVWHFFYLPTRTPRERATMQSNISYFNVEANSTIIMSFQELPDPPTEPPTDPTTDPEPSPSPSPSPTGAPVPPMESPTEPPSTDPTTLPPMTTSTRSGALKLAVGILAHVLSLTIILACTYVL